MKRRPMPSWYMRTVRRRNMRAAWGSAIFLGHVRRGILSTVHKSWSVREDQRFDREVRAAAKREFPESIIKVSYPLDPPRIIAKWRMK
jgi:hypothetical protein